MPVGGSTCGRQHFGLPCWGLQKSDADAVIYKGKKKWGQPNIKTKDYPSNIEGIFFILLLVSFAKEKNIFNINHKMG